MAELLSLEDLPEGFDYPSEFIRVVELGMVNLEPWWILEGDLLRGSTRASRSDIRGAVSSYSPAGKTTMTWHVGI